MVFSDSGPGRSQLAHTSTDPVVVGLGRLLIGVGVLTLVAGLLTVVWLILCGCGAI